MRGLWSETCSPWKKLSRRRGISVQLAPRILCNGYDARNELYRFLRASSPQHSEALVRKTGSADPKMPNACGPSPPKQFGLHFRGVPVSQARFDCSAQRNIYSHGSKPLQMVHIKFCTGECSADKPPQRRMQRSETYTAENAPSQLCSSLLHNWEASCCLKPEERQFSIGQQPADQLTRPHSRSSSRSRCFDLDSFGSLG